MKTIIYFAIGALILWFLFRATTNGGTLGSSATPGGAQIDV